MTARRFPPPWSAEAQPNYCVVRDANKQQLAYVYYENEPGRRSAAKLLEHQLDAETKFANLVRDSAAEGMQLKKLGHFPMKSIS